MTLSCPPAPSAHLPARRPKVPYPLSPIPCSFRPQYPDSGLPPPAPDRLRSPTRPAHSPPRPAHASAQNTPDFSAPAQAEYPHPNRRSGRRIPAHQACPPANADRPHRAPPLPFPTPAPPLPPPSLAVFSRPTALGILSAGGLLYSAPGAGAVTNLQLGATLTITGRSADGAWFAAYLADGIAGWVPAAQVRVFGDANELEIVQESLGPAVVATLIAEASKPQAPVTTLIARLTPAPPDP